MEQFGVKLWIILLKICKKSFFFFNKDTQANRLGTITNKYLVYQKRQIHKICTLFSNSAKCKSIQCCRKQKYAQLERFVFRKLFCGI